MKTMRYYLSRLPAPYAERAIIAADNTVRDEGDLGLDDEVRDASHALLFAFEWSEESHNKDEKPWNHLHNQLVRGDVKITDEPFQPMRTSRDVPAIKPKRRGLTL